MEKILSGICVVLGIVIVGMYIYNTKLENTVANLQAKLVASETNEFKLNKEIEVQNEAITKLAIDKASLDKEYNDLLNKPEEVRFEKVYVKVPSIGVKSDECKDIKNLIDDIRAAGY